jgi:tetratricopeptide (TPR) repeat protein
MKTLLLTALLASLASPAFAADPPPKPDPKALIQEGVGLHDAGKYAEAIQRFKGALEADPENTEALYEMANTYFAMDQYALCEEAARKALKKPGPLEGPLYSMAGSCLSSAGKAKEAMKLFEEGLAKHPKDRLLNFNAAVRLKEDGKGTQAIPYLQRAIEARPSYSSPYFVLGDIYAQEGRAIEEIFYLLRFVSLEPNGKRAEAASAQVFEFLTAGVKTDQGTEDNVQITLSPTFGEAKDKLQTLEVARTLAAATIHLEEAKKQSKAQRYVSALSSFIKMTGEMGEGDPGVRSADAFLWSRAVAPILRLDQQGALEPLAYILALRSGFEGAEEWIRQNPTAMQKLQTALDDAGR